MAVGRQVLTRLALALVLVVLVTMLLFGAVEVLPGDAATTILGADATPERVEALRSQLRLDEPVLQRYGDWLTGVLGGDLGRSVISGRPTGDVIATPLRNSVVLAGGATVAMTTVAVGVGVVAGRRPGSLLDRFLTSVVALAASTPDFVLGTLLIAVFGSWLGLLPAVSLIPIGKAPWSDPRILILPVATMALVGGAYGARLVRAVVADANTSPHVEAAELAGLPERLIVSRHLLPGIAGSVAQVVASLVPYAIGGTIVVERLFGFPGIGSLFVEQLAIRDVVVVEAIGLVLSVVVIASLFTADLIGILTSPRNRHHPVAAGSP